MRSTDFQTLTVAGLNGERQRVFVSSARQDEFGSFQAIIELRDFGGRVLWTETIPGTYVVIHHMVHSGGRLYVVGISQGTIDGKDAIGARDIFIAAYDVSDAFSQTLVRQPRKLWLTTFGLPGAPHSIFDFLQATIDREGDVIVTTTMASPQYNFPDRLPDDPRLFSSSGYVKGLLIKVAADGRRKWIRQFGSTTELSPQALTTDCYGNIWVAGATRSAFSGATTSSNDSIGSFIARFDRNGAAVWALWNVLGPHAPRSKGAYHVISDIQVDADGKLIVAGYYTDSWGLQPERGKRGFAASLRDNAAHGYGPGGYFKCRSSQDAAAPPAATTGRCASRPDPTVWINTCTKQPRPHEGFKGSERCSNNIDDDGDGLCDKADPDCLVDERSLRFTEGCCRRPPDYPPQREVWRLGSKVCSDGWDNDDNGRCDALEPACKPPVPGAGQGLSGSPASPIPQVQPQHTTPSTASSACASSVQGTVPASPGGSKNWDALKLSQLCRNAERSLEPGRCYAALMRGNVSWGANTRWNPHNALQLCAGSLDSNRTISCFTDNLNSGRDWQKAIAVCKRP